MPTSAPDLVALRLRVVGHVQGVGFRPFVKRLADRLGIAGYVGNDADGVFVVIEGERDQADGFLKHLRDEAPEAVRIESVQVESTKALDRDGFDIAACPAEDPGAPGRARVPLDRTVCDRCLAEFRDSADRRHRYPFANCTCCGPRYTVLARLPYERDATTMIEFPLCEECASEFADVAERRFHAEVMACPHCGPRTRFEDSSQAKPTTNEDAMRSAAETLRRGEIVALKGLGGYQLLARADDSAVVARLRLRKSRPTKPLAVMVRSVQEASRHVDLNPRTIETLESPENPIVVLPRRVDSTFAPEIAPRLREVGLMLPTTLLHHRLLELVDFPVVATSANRGEEPILGDDTSSDDLLSLADAILTHDRPIARRLDDSVIRVTSDGPQTLRLARGYAPLPLPAIERWLARHAFAPGGVLALGGQQKNAIALWTGTQAVLGPHFGDLESGRSRAVWERHLDELGRLYGTKVRTLVADRHPDYAATRWAVRSGLPVIEVAHHHAHAAAAMVEHDLLDRNVLAFTWDGTGLGPDGGVWGGECLSASLSSFDRIASLRPFRLPGGEAAIRQPWRIGLSLDRDALGDTSLPTWPDVPNDSICGLSQMLDRDVSCTPTTSLGRLFDGVASLLLGISTVSYEGEAAAILEATADPVVHDAYPVDIDRRGAVAEWDWRETLRTILRDREDGIPVSTIAARFHNTVAAWAERVAVDRPEGDVVLAGGCFQNVLLTERVGRALERIGKRVHRPRLIPVNDGGLAAGQLAIGLARMATGSR